MQTTSTLPTTPSTQGPVTPDLEQQQRREQATKRIRDKNAFKLHLVAYLVINALFVVLWALSGIGYFWPIFPIVGWGAGVAVHGYCVYGGNKVTEAQIERDMKRLP